jgi:hypothetical protein
VREARLRWYGHVIRRDEGELVRDIMEWRDQKKMWGGRHCREGEGSKAETLSLTKLHINVFIVYCIWWRIRNQAAVGLWRNLNHIFDNFTCFIKNVLEIWFVVILVSDSYRYKQYIFVH